MPAVSSIIAVVGIVAAASSSRKTRKENARARRIQERRGRLEAARQTTEQVRQAQIARAQIIQQAEAQGVQESSPVQGALGSVQSQTGGNIAFAQQIFNLQQRANSRILAANNALGRANLFGQIATFSANLDTGNPTPAPVETSVPIAGPGI